MSHRSAAAVALLFSGFTALVYQIIWTRLLGFVFGATSEAIGTVLAVFFGGLALGNWLAARRIDRVERPLRVYALLELGVGLFALLSLPLLRRMDTLHAWIPGEHGELAWTAIRLGAAALVLLPPTIAMGATLPVVARGVVGDDRSLGRWSAILYAANTFGAVAGAYLCGFWLIPKLGLTRTVLAAGVVNLAVALAIFVRVGGRVVTPASLGQEAARASAAPPGRTAFLVFFGISGFVAIGYEVVWSKLFSIVMEGTLYGFATVLSAYLFGIAAGSLAISPFVDRIRDVPRAYGLLHVAIAAAVGAGMALVPFMPWLNGRLLEWTGGQDPVHVLFLVAAPVVVVPAALFGAAFPLLIRIYTRDAERVGEGMGMAVAVNTLGSIAASLLVGFWAIESLGMDATLFALIVLDLGMALLVLMRFQSAQGRERLAVVGAAATVLLGVSLGYNGVSLDETVAGRVVPHAGLGAYVREVERITAGRLLVAEGRNSVVTVSEDARGRTMQTNGMPEASTWFGPPHRPPTTALLGVLPYLVADAPERALVIGLGGGNTVRELLATPLSSIEAVELEEGVVRAVAVLHEGQRNPLDDPRVVLHVNDGRNVLVRGRYASEPGFDLIASQPSHPWLMGAANLFTEEYFALARDNLREGGVFAMWVNGGRTDPDSLLSIVNSFERIFPGALLADISGVQNRSAMLLLGMRGPVVVDTDRMAERLTPELRAVLRPHGLDGVANLLAVFEGRAADFAALSPELANTDDNAFVETRIPRRTSWDVLDYGSIEARLDPAAPVLPPLRGSVDVADVARALLAKATGPGRYTPLGKLRRLLRNHAEGLDPVLAATLRADANTRDPATEPRATATLQALADAHPLRAEPWRALGRHRAERRHDWAAAGQAFGEAWLRSRRPADAYDAARSLDHTDPEAAWQWALRIPPERRAEMPRFALFEARERLRRDAEPAALRASFDALVGYRDSEEGRSLPGVSAVLAELAQRLDARGAARAFRDADLRERRQQAQPLQRRVRRALEEGDLDTARHVLGRCEALLPGDPASLELQLELARRTGDPRALETALQQLRLWAPDLGQAEAAETRERLHFAGGRQP